MAFHAPTRGMAGTGTLTPSKPRSRRRGGGSEGDLTWPPGSGDGGNGGGGGRGDGRGGGGGGGRSGDGNQPRPDPATAIFGFALFLMGIGTLFLVFIGAYVMLRQRSIDWPPPNSPGPPEGLWASTLLLVLSSTAMVCAVGARRSERRSSTRGWLGLASLSGLLFLLVQAYLWRGMISQGFVASSNAYGAVFYSLTGLHALHVLGGLGFLCKVLIASYGAPAALTRGAVELCAIYWHFMGGVWIVLFFVLYFLS